MLWNFNTRGSDFYDATQADEEEVKLVEERMSQVCVCEEQHMSHVPGLRFRADLKDRTD